MINTSPWNNARRYAKTGPRSFQQDIGKTSVCHGYSSITDNQHPQWHLLPPSPLLDLQIKPPIIPKLEFRTPFLSAEARILVYPRPFFKRKNNILADSKRKHLCIPPQARSFPYLESDEIEQKDHELRNPERAIKRVGFDGEQGLGAQAPQSAYLSARYESRRESTDFSVLDYLQGHTELNPSQDIHGSKIDTTALERVIKDLRLGELVDMPVSNLSNGQTRRARIARALLGNPEVLLLDEPFMGLDRRRC